MENKVLVTLRPYIIEDVNYKHLGVHFVKKGIITRDEDMEISNLVGKSKITRFMDLICSREGAMEEFIYALRNPVCYSLYKNLILKIEYTYNKSLKSSAFTTTTTTTTNNGSNHVVQHSPANGNGKQNGSSLKQWTANKTVEKRHFNELVRILKNGSTNQWKKLYEGLGIELCEMFSTAQKLERGMIDTAEAFRDVIDTWRENDGKKATFGVLYDVLRSKVLWLEAADDVSDHRWD